MLHTSVPVFDRAVPRARRDFRLLQRVPLAPDRDLVVRPERLENPPGLPVPEVALPLRIAGHDEPSVRGKVHLARVPRVGVPGEPLLLVQTEFILRAVNHDLVIETLARDPVPVRGRGHRGHRVHRRIRDVLHRHGDPKLPHPQRFVIRRRRETPALVAKRDRVHRAQVLVVLLHDVPGVHVVLQNLLVALRGHENVLLVLVRVHFHRVRDLAGGQRPNHLSGFRVPEF
mmetsp:Transcript_4287/g.15113  ORF Transcript_4287/g.15113 Transcript_4287/m.15113 type:complete len:229 (+) Transcript_4287:37-723(+)